MFENPRRGRQARNFTANVPKILVLKSSSEQIFSRKLPLGAPVIRPRAIEVKCENDHYDGLFRPWFSFRSDVSPTLRSTKLKKQTPPIPPPKKKPATQAINTNTEK